MLSEPIAVTAKVTSILQKLHVPYFIVGSLASTLYGKVRTTQDSDIVADMRAEHIQSFVQALQSEFYVDEEMIADAISRQSSFNIIHRESMFKVDVFIPHERTFVRKQFARAREEILSVEPEIRAMVSSAEDVLLAKLEWYRMGGEVSERQWSDILGVLKVQQGSLDLDYLRQMANELKVIDLLERALVETR
ncbi:MAG TPA: hypothetical protein VJM08_07260 [Anaerolineales bacterium]|nr:hypothetical protein [Anaerolineales bacterium]